MGSCSNISFIHNCKSCCVSHSTYSIDRGQRSFKGLKPLKGCALCLAKRGKFRVQWAVKQMYTIHFFLPYTKACVNFSDVSSCNFLSKSLLIQLQISFFAICILSPTTHNHYSIFLSNNNIAPILSF